MKLKNGFIKHQTGKYSVLVSVNNRDFSGMVRLNRSAEFIVDCLQKETTEEKIVDAMFEKYDAPREELKKGVQDVLTALRRVGALEE